MEPDDLPSDLYYPSAREWASAATELRNHLMEARPRVFPPGPARTCPVCSEVALASRDDLVREVVVGAIALVHHNLHGARCESCGTEFLEAYEELALEDAGPERTLTDYQAKVTSVSGRNLGTYWPKDVVRVMDLHSQGSACKFWTRIRCSSGAGTSIPDVAARPPPAT